MNKTKTIAIAVAISTFLIVNLYLLFSDKSVIPKSVYVSHYERMTSSDYRKEIPKVGLVAPEEIYTIYVGNEETIDTWLVKEGDVVTVGDKIATLQTEQAEGQRMRWEAEFEALQEQRFTIQNMITDLDSQWKQAQSNGNTAINQQETEVEDGIGWNIDVQVDVNQDASYAQAIAAAEQELATIERQLVVIEMQLLENSTRPALISPVEGVVSKINRLGSTLAIEIFSAQKILVTYVNHHEGQEAVSGNRVYIQEEGVKKSVEGMVQTVSTVPAPENEWVSAYKILDDTEMKNPLTYYEVRMSTESDLQSWQYGMNMDTAIVVDEALDAVSVKKQWLDDFSEKTATAWVVDETGRASKVEIVTPFTLKKRVVITEGLQLGDIVVYKSDSYGETPKIFLPFPTDIPKKKEWRAFGWKNYVKYILVQ